jgi:hypothetical protein
VHASSTRESSLAPGDLVRCQLNLPGSAEPVSVTGRVRRVGHRYDEPDRPATEVGLEFEGLFEESGEFETIRDYVLEQQRSRLARRVQVAGVGDW